MAYREDKKLGVRELVKCPICGEGSLRIVHSNAQSLTLFMGKIACCNPRCRKFESSYTLSLHDFRIFQDAVGAPEISTWTKTLKEQQKVDERQLEIPAD